VVSVVISCRCVDGRVEAVLSEEVDEALCGLE